METHHRFGFNVVWDIRTISMLVVLLALPNVLGMLNLATPWGFKLHMFQVGIFVSALLYGPFGGALSGLVGSVYSAIIMNNPYIAVGNAILGFFVGMFVRYGLHTVLAVALGFVIQLPWLILTDHYLVGMSGQAILMLVFALAISNSIWAICAHHLAPRLRPA